MPSPAPILVLGDTQLASRVEQFLLRRERNDAQQRRLLAHAAEERFDLFVHLGDAVFDGGSADEWARLDRLLAPVIAQAPAQLVPGNHEYWRGRADYERYARACFPHAGGQSWSARRHGVLGLIFLDSNRRRLGRARWIGQLDWYRRTLAEMEGDPTITDVLVFAHHPPFTNSRVSGDARHVQIAFLEAFFAARKTCVFLSGHAHGYERFEKHGKTFVVSGGGGGPRVRYRVARRRRHRDVAMGQTMPARRPFHYVTGVQLPGGGVELAAKGFVEDEPLRVFDRWRG